MRRFDDFLEGLTPDVWKEIFDVVNIKKEYLINYAFRNSGIDETQMNLKADESLLTLELLERYHNWLSSSMDDS